MKGRTYVVEKMLSAVESEAAIALRNMLATWPPSQKDRESWSLLMAFQVTRGRGFRDSASAAFVYLLKAQIALDSRDLGVMSERLRAAGLEPTEENLDILRKMMDAPDSYNLQMHPAHQVKLAMETGLEMLPLLAGRTWNLGILRDPTLVTTDHPLTLHSDPESRGPFGGVGLMTADEVWMPLDPTRLLVMSHPDTDSRVADVPDELVPSINLRIAAECYEWVIARPDNPHVEAIADFIKGRPAAGLTIAGPTLEEWAAAGQRMSGTRQPPSDR
jgi:hypothetical protein